MAVSVYTLISVILFALCCSPSNAGEKIWIEVNGSNGQMKVAGYLEFGPEIIYGLRGCLQNTIKDSLLLPMPIDDCTKWIAFMQSADLSEIPPDVVEEAGYSAIILSGTKPDTGFKNHANLTIPAIHVDEKDGKLIEKNAKSRYYVWASMEPANMKLQYIINKMLPWIIALLPFLFRSFRRFLLNWLLYVVRKVLLCFPRDNQQDFAKLPKRNYKPGDEMDTCYICMEEYESEEELTELPCRHRFHTSCIKIWVVDYKRNSCAVCRQEIFKLVLWNL